MNKSLYSSRSNLILAFHGCDKAVAEQVLAGKLDLKKSQNDYDWLGSSIYFWENNEARALDFAKELMLRPNSKIKEPAVIGAVLNLGNCMDLTDAHFLSELAKAHDALVKTFQEANIPLPQNRNVGNNRDLLLRHLDCAVVNYACKLNQEALAQACGDLDESSYEYRYDFDSVKGLFTEGDPLYSNSGFQDKNHVQICVRNTNCIKGFFRPRDLDTRYTNP